MNNKLLWALQVIAALILIPVGLLKFGDNPGDILVFERLGMEPFGRYLIGSIEVFSGLCLLTLHFSAVGSLLGVGVMVGAIIAHVTELGFEARMISLLGVNLLCCALVFWGRREHLPIIGRTLV